MRFALGCVALSLVVSASAASADEKADKQFRKWADERIQILATDKDFAKRADAAEYLGGSQYPGVVAALTAALADPHPRVRAAAAGSLWESHKIAEPARAALQKALDDASGDVSIRAAGALEALGVPAKDLAQTRRRVLNAPAAQDDARFMAASGLIDIDPATNLLDPIVAYLARWAPPVAVSDSSYEARRTNIDLVERALEELAETKDRGLVAPLTKALRSGQPGGAQLVATLGRFDPKPTGWTDTLVTQLRSRDPDLLKAVLRQLRGQRTEKDVTAWAPQVALLVRDTETSVRYSAVDTLGAAGGLAWEQVGAVIDALATDPEQSVRLSAARALTQMGDQTAAVPMAAKKAVADRARGPLLTAAAKDADADVRQEAAKAARGLAPGGAATTAEVARNPTVVANTAAEGPALALLRERGVAFDEWNFFRAIGENDAELVKAFVDAGIPVTRGYEGTGDLPLKMAVGSRACSPMQRPTNPETMVIVQALVSKGATAGQADAHGNTPLMEAAMAGCDREVMRLLVKAGGNVNAANAAGLTAFEMGLYSGHDGLEELLAAGYRLPAVKAATYKTAYASQPKALALIAKATAGR